jgi:hypothetical protein
VFTIHRGGFRPWRFFNFAKDHLLAAFLRCFAQSDALARYAPIVRFWLAILSAVVGIGIQICSVWVQIALQIENQVASLALDALRTPKNYGIEPAADWCEGSARILCFQ